MHIFMNAILKLFFPNPLPLTLPLPLPLSRPLFYRRVFAALCGLRQKRVRVRRLVLPKLRDRVRVFITRWARWARLRLAVKRVRGRVRGRVMAAWRVRVVCARSKRGAKARFFRRLRNCFAFRKIFLPLSKQARRLALQAISRWRHFTLALHPLALAAATAHRTLTLCRAFQAAIVVALASRHRKTFLKMSVFSWFRGYSVSCYRCRRAHAVYRLGAGLRIGAGLGLGLLLAA